MAKSILRIATFLLVPCLTVMPAPATNFSSVPLANAILSDSISSSDSAWVSIFNKEALNLPLIASTQLHRALHILDRLSFGYLRQYFGEFFGSHSYHALRDYTGSFLNRHPEVFQNQESLLASMVDPARLSIELLP